METSHLGVGTENRLTITPAKSEVCEQYKRIDNKLYQYRQAVISIHKGWLSGRNGDSATRANIRLLARNMLQENEEV